MTDLKTVIARIKDARQPIPQPEGTQVADVVLDELGSLLYTLAHLIRRINTLEAFVYKVSDPEYGAPDDVRKEAKALLKAF